MAIKNERWIENASGFAKRRPRVMEVSRSSLKDSKSRVHHLINEVQFLEGLNPNIRQIHLSSELADNGDVKITEFTIIYNSGVEISFWDHGPDSEFPGVIFYPEKHKSEKDIGQIDVFKNEDGDYLLIQNYPTSTSKIAQGLEPKFRELLMLKDGFEKSEIIVSKKN